MNEEIMNEIQPVRPKDQFPFSCRQCGACCRNIEGCVMVESLDAYRLAQKTYILAPSLPNSSAVLSILSFGHSFAYGIH